MNEIKGTMNGRLGGFMVVSIINLMLLCSFDGMDTIKVKKDGGRPKIVNIVNFIRLLEPRDAKITEDVLYETVVKQVDMMKKYKLGGTFFITI